MGIEAVDKYLYLLAGNKIQKSLMDFIQELECTFHKKFTHSILGMATLFLTKIIRCCECCGVMAPIALDNEHPRI
ncbi:hypothetical protein [Enterococcus faecium]|uniref:hypothetical protein n=1 Tax=Enterococcus faecium TaxID=1352 RepID=UPI002244B2B1|nr:hypothetical protein [Enterococcus faecium]